jgi:hypothetical protein
MWKYASYAMLSSSYFWRCHQKLIHSRGKKVPCEAKTQQSVLYLHATSNNQVNLKMMLVHLNMYRTHGIQRILHTQHQVMSWMKAYYLYMQLDVSPIMGHQGWRREQSKDQIDNDEKRIICPVDLNVMLLCHLVERRDIKWPNGNGSLSGEEEAEQINEVEELNRCIDLHKMLFCKEKT